MFGYFKHLMLVAACVLCGALLVGCKKDSEKIPSIGSAFAGPIELKLREEISPASKTIATAKHGEKLDILQVRRRFVRVRTPSGQIGWTDSRSLLSSRQMEGLGLLAKRSTKLPSQGEATVYAPLNMHAEPFRSSVSFYQLTEGIRVDVVAHRLSPRSKPGEPVANTLDLKKPDPPRSRRKKKEPDYPPPPRPPAPELPEDWLELSKTPVAEPPPAPPADPNDKTKKKRRVRKRYTGPPVENWTLVRTKDGKAGWVLSRMLVMGIPDEVAQYAEGARITSYFLLGTVDDAGLTKHHWLWTTMRDENAPYDFDSFRVFTYVVKKHRYETAYIERNIEGYYPVSVQPGRNGRFTLILREADGKLYKKTWVMDGYIARKLEEVPYDPDAEKAAPEKPDESLTDKIRTLLDQ
jgi:hypothetical protein